MKKRHLIITIAALSILCLSGCHKDKPVESQAPLETIAPETTSETISDKLDDDSDSLDIGLEAETLGDDAVVLGFETEASTESSSTDSETTSESETASDSDDSAVVHVALPKETISESEARAILESEMAERQSGGEEEIDWAEQNKEMENAVDSYYSQQSGEVTPEK